MQRRHVLAAGIAWPFADHAMAVSPLRDERALRLRDGEAALERGDAAVAESAFDLAAQSEHALDIELGIVRSAMQAGRYRSALRFAAHTAGAHADEPEGAILYAWLLAVGGQPAAAYRALAIAQARRPHDATIDLARRALSMADAPPQAAWLGTGVRLAPHSAGNLPAGAGIVATGFRVPRTELALAPSAALSPASRTWTRDGLGRLCSAQAVRTIDALGLTLLRISGAQSFDTEATPPLVLAEHDPFPGAPATALRYAIADSAAPAWPWLHQGFFGGAGAWGDRGLGIDVPPRSGGGPVFDGAGRWIGIVLETPRAVGTPVIVLPSRLREHIPEVAAAAPASSPTHPTGRMPADAIYERAMGLVLQVICAA